VVDGQTLVAIDGAPEGTVVVSGRMGQLREGTAVTTAAATPAAVPASRAAP